MERAELGWPSKRVKVNRGAAYLGRVVVDVLHGDVYAGQRLAEGIVHLASLDLESQRGVGKLLEVDLADEKELAGLGVHLEEAALVTQDDAVPEARVYARVLVEGHDGRLDAHLVSYPFALQECARLVVAKRWRAARLGRGKQTYRYLG